MPSPFPQALTLNASLPEVGFEVSWLAQLMIYDWTWNIFNKRNKQA